MIYLLLLGAGMLGGFLAGLLGIGGGFVVVPVLIVLLPAFGIAPDLLPKVAVATSLAVMVPTACSAVFAQYRRGALDLASVRSLAPSAGIGAAIGAQLAAALTGQWVALIFAIYAGYFAVKMLRDVPVRPQSAGRLANAVLKCPTSFIGALIGAFSSIAGVGGASLTVPYLLFHNVEMKRAVATSSAVGLAIAVAGAASFAFARADIASIDSPMLFGLVCWPAALVLASSAILMAPQGVAWSHRLPVRQLKRAFGAVLVAACGAMLIKATVSTESEQQQAQEVVASVVTRDAGPRGDL